MICLFRTIWTFHLNTPPIGPSQGWLSSALLTATSWRPSCSILLVPGSSLINLLVLQWELKRVSLSVEYSVEHIFMKKITTIIFQFFYHISIDVVSEIKGIWCYVTMEYELYSSYTKPHLNKHNGIKFH